MPSAMNEEKGREGTVLALRIVFLFIAALFIFRLFQLQIVQGSSFREKAVKLAQRTSRISAQRGEIYDRNFNVPLVINSDSFAIDVVPAEIGSDERDSVFSRLAAALSISVEDIRKKVIPAYYHLYQPIEIKGQVPYETVARISERIDEFPGVTWHEKPMRNYLETGSLSHIIGYVGDINLEELQVLYNQGYQSGDVIGKMGIEKQYDVELRGKDGYENRTVDVKGRKISSTVSSIEPPEPGKNLVLTIDRNVQQLCEKALGNRLGAVVALKPDSGEILAMVSYPWYNPQLFMNENSNKEFLALLNDKTTPFVNRSIQSSYPPASTFKMIMSAAILEEQLVSPQKKIDCDGEINYGDRIFRCWIRRPGHGPLDLRGALAQSCDVYFWTIAKDNMGVDRIVDYAKLFGLSEKTGIDLPGEISGFIPTPKWKERRFHEKWLGGDTLNMSIGQGYTLVTPLQMANVVSQIANDGIVYRPHVLKEIREADTNNLMRRVDREVLRTSNISTGTYAQVRDNMRAVITEGTARGPVGIKSVQIAGKTGTGEVGQADHWHSWFAAYAPFDSKNPGDKVVVSIIVEAANDWEWWAPYASAIIFQGIFANQNYEEAVAALGPAYTGARAAGRRE